MSDRAYANYMNHSKMASQCFVIAILLLSIFTPIGIVSATASAPENQAATTSFTLSGNVFAADGEIGDRTSIKVDSMTSSWSDNGTYIFSEITPGEHTVRAYFMNNGHTVVYRKMFFTSDMQLDWQEGKNWVTTQVFDNNSQHVSNTAMTTVKLIETEESKSLDSGRAEFGPFSVNQYYTIRAYYGDIDHTTQYVHFKMERGSMAGGEYPHVNDFDFNHGMNSRYGFITDDIGNPISGVTVSNGTITTLTNSDGFYLLQNMEVGSSQTLTFHQSGIEIIDPVTVLMTSGPGWLNQSTPIQVELPANVSFTTPMQTLPISSIQLEWQGGQYTDYYSIYAGEVEEENLIYRGYSTSFVYNPQNPGMINFNVVANNSNGSTTNFNSLRIIFLPLQSSDDLWNVGMSWDFHVSYVPSGTIRNVTMTMIGSEIIEDAFGVEKSTFLMRLSGDYQMPDERSYRWVDSETLLNIHTYWVDDPSSSSYYQEGTLGWDFTDQSGNTANLLSAASDLNLHFNRTNIIGVPGHPDGYSDTQNTVTIEEGVLITTAAGTFSTKYIQITDNDDQMVSWELWYNDTIRNWVKIIDRLSGSHSDKVEYELTSYDVPTTPQFITEAEVINSNDYTIEWSQYNGAQNYHLLENGILIYQGDSTSFELQNRNDGKYTYSLNAEMDGYMIEGDLLEIEFSYIPPKPLVFSSASEVNEGEVVTIYWPSIEDSERYSLIVQDADGNTMEMYNGSDNFTILEDLLPGQNRIRVNNMAHGKISEYSDSIFIKVEDSEDGIISAKLIVGLALSILLLQTIIKKKERDANE